MRPADGVWCLVTIFASGLLIATGTNWWIGGGVFMGLLAVCNSIISRG